VTEITTRRATILLLSADEIVFTDLASSIDESRAACGKISYSRGEIRAGSRFRSAILTDLAMRGFAISFLTLARVGSSGFFLPFLCDMPDHHTQVEAIQFHFAQLRCGPVRS